MNKDANQKEFIKLSYKARFSRWVKKDPAEALLPMLTVGVFAVAAGVILIALYIEANSLLVSIGTGLSIIGGCIVAMALVLSTMQRGKRSRKNIEPKSDKYNRERKDH